jgi:transcriptional regulator with XRE-family HTH domain
LSILLLTMSTTGNRAATPQIRFDAHLMAEDMAVLGWTKLDLARRARVADMTVIRFLRGERQTPRTAKKLADALGHTVRRYLISSREAVA